MRHDLRKIRNPKLEIRNKFEIWNSTDRNGSNAVSVISSWILLLVSNFELRISDLMNRGEAVG